MNPQRPIKPFQFEGSFQDDLEVLWRAWMALSARYGLPRAIVAEVDLALVRLTRFGSTDR